MFTPHRVAGGTGRDIKLKKTRVTVGTFVASGEKFKRIDHYTEPRGAHLMLEHAWIGTTEFQEIVNYEDANIKNFTRWADWASGDEFEGFDAAAPMRPQVGESEKRQLKMFEEKGHIDTKASARHALLSLSARVPLRRVPPVGWCVRTCTGAGHLFTCAVQRVDRWWSRI